MMLIVFISFSLFYIVPCSSQEPLNACPGRCSIKLCHQPGKPIISFYNQETFQGAYIDYESNVYMLLDGTTGDGFSVDMASGSALYLQREYSNLSTWLHTEQTFEQYIQLSSTVNYETHVSYATNVFNINSPPYIENQMAVKIIESLEPETIEFNEFTNKVSFSMFSELSQHLTTAVKLNLRYLLDRNIALMGSVKGGFHRIVSTFSGISTLLSTTDHLETAMAQPSFDYEPLFYGETGTETLAIIASQVSVTHDLNTFTPTGNSLDLATGTILTFGGGGYRSYFGIEALICHLVRFLHGLTNLETLIDVILQVVSTVGKIKLEMFKRKIGFIISILEALDNTHAMIAQAVVSLKQLAAGALHVAKINIGAIISKLFSIGSFGLDMVMKLLTPLATVTSLSVCTAVVFFRMMFFVISGIGMKFVKVLVPSIHFKFELTGESFLRQLIRRVSPLKLLESMTSFSVERVVYSIPVFGDIFKALNASIQRLHIQAVNWVQEFASGRMARTCFSWLKSSLNLPGGSRPDGQINGLMIGFSASVRLW